MSKQKTLHVVLRNEGWVVRKEGNSRAVSTHKTQREAIEAARKVARANHGELIIHGKDGRIANRNRYSSVPLPAKSVPKVLFHQTLDDKGKKALQAAVKTVLTKAARRSSQQVETARERQGLKTIEILGRLPFTVLKAKRSKRQRSCCGSKSRSSQN